MNASFNSAYHTDESVTRLLQMVRTNLFNGLGLTVEDEGVQWF